MYLWLWFLFRYPTPFVNRPERFIATAERRIVLSGTLYGLSAHVSAAVPSESPRTGDTGKVTAMALNGSGMSDTARGLGISAQTVMGELKEMTK